MEAGGAERMAISYANALVEKIEFSGLVATRKEGQLIDQVNENVFYLFLNKKRAIDFTAIYRLRRYLKENKVAIIHAHGSSFFTAILVKLTLPKIKVIWHDHYGLRSNQSRSQNKILNFCSLFFTSIFTVNLQLQKWSEKNLFCKKVIFVPNFTLQNGSPQKITILKGEKGKRIVFLANLKKPKNHIIILKAFYDLKLKDLGWSLHLIGKDYNDNYSQCLKDFIESNSLENHIHLCGNRNDIEYILFQCSIGVLASTAEGFPVTLLEYALANLAVVSTNVGYCSEIIEEEVNGLLFDPSDESELKRKLTRIVNDQLLRDTLSSNFKETVIKKYSKETVIKQLMIEYRNCKNEK
ncbi:glycosyltransferase [Flavobacterium cutihirudinis]|uniref:glycosyltransferase n=1 Tax=Flavobacterium cutihirudinis TaxID=1265740 RepID=UPI001FC9DEBD|nr:glycosyltransferase [Flavobacterium cutihirudinis]